jgi:hypothetical protein
MDRVYSYSRRDLGDIHENLGNRSCLRKPALNGGYMKMKAAYRREGGMQMLGHTSITRRERAAALWLLPIPEGTCTIKSDCKFYH